MLLQYLVENIEKKTNGDLNININKVEYNSAKVEKGDLFVAIKGYEQDGHDYINDAIQAGATAIVLQDESKIDKNSEVTYVVVKDSRIALAEIAANFYDNPASKLKIIGVTGTKGKTTTAYMIRDIMLAAGITHMQIKRLNHIEQHLSH